MPNVKHDPGNLPEFAGSNIGLSLLNALLACDSQAARLPQIRDALNQLCQECDHRDRAIGGFAVTLVNVLEQGLGVHP